MTGPNWPLPLRTGCRSVATPLARVFAVLILRADCAELACSTRLLFDSHCSPRLQPESNTCFGGTSSIKVGLMRMNRPGMSGDSTSWEGWSHVRWFVEEVPAGTA